MAQRLRRLRCYATKHGREGPIVYRAVGDLNDVTATHDFDTAEKAKAFVESSELHEAMDNAGVAGAPEIWITDQA